MPEKEMVFNAIDPKQRHNRLLIPGNKVYIPIQMILTDIHWRTMKMHDHKTTTFLREAKLFSHESIDGGQSSNWLTFYLAEQSQIPP